MSTLFFGFGSFTVLAIATALSVYMFGSYDRAWGKDGTVQVWWMMALALSIGATLAFRSGLGLGQRSATPVRAVALGAVAALIYVLYLSVAKSLHIHSGVLVFLLLPILAALCAFATPPTSAHEGRG